MYPVGWQEETAYHPSVYQIDAQPQQLFQSESSFQPYMTSGYLPDHQHLLHAGSEHGSFSVCHQEAPDPNEACSSPQSLLMQPPRSSDSRHQLMMESDPVSPNLDPVRDKDLPYAKLIYKCLQEAPNHTMVLKEIYDWFKANTDKAQDPAEKGWQNSIRHNLSMNKVGLTILEAILFV
jgi:hypothetical protein